MAIAELTISPKGRALNPDGSLAAVPSDLASDIDTTLLRVVALMHCARMEVPIAGAEDGTADDLHDASSRAVSLLVVAEEKVREVLESLSPYV